MAGDFGDLASAGPFFVAGRPDLVQRCRSASAATRAGVWTASQHECSVRTAGPDSEHPV